ncbi:bifunctional isochorismate lyase/aryl carrier protein [Stackebrandtia albiflava]|uniref:isochorismatase n=1 Tax=Stackebrandtia albiflava TaxID=406432 RepID=A0A562VBH6_9ACTN|nr:isochorismatase family protein [Stackebrandtia albiflava]TWJ15210.1 bifunctional isochorismate lyase/aryl carrier protein [Stackebrandtia albiflava]
MSIPRLTGHPLPTTMPDNRLTWAFDPNRAALLIHDMQRYFLGFYADGFPRLVDNVARLRALGLPTVYTAQPPRQSAERRGLLTDRWGPGLQSDEEIVSALAPREGDEVLTKHRYSAFFGTDLRGWLASRGLDQLVICGVYAHIGVTATALDAFSADVKPFVVADAVGDFSADDHAAAMRHLAATCAVVTTVDGLSSGPTLAEVRRQVLALLDEPADDDENLIDAGLDSVRVMGLIETWRAAGHDVGFADLAADPTIIGFHSRLVSA